jgi:hypothetical protein
MAKIILWTTAILSVMVPSKTFCIEVSIPVSINNPEDLCRRVKSWFTQWTEANQVWQRNWLSDNEALWYEQEFKDAPQVISCNWNELTIRLEGQPSAKWWKDSLVNRILKEIETDFAEILGVGHIKDCD